MKTVYLKVDEEYVDGAGKIAGAKGSNRSTDILVEFSPDWEVLSKYATTRDAKGLHPETTVLGLDKREPIGEEGEGRYAYRFSLTSNAMCEEGQMSVTFTGYEIEGGNETSTVINTALAKLRVLPSDYAEMDDGSVTPTIAQQLQAEIDAIEAEYSELPERVAEAEGYANASHASATESKSYAVGGTESRAGEDTDNSKYYSEQSGYASAESTQKANDSSSSATLSTSYAVGGTQTREGEDTDNAKYYMQQAQAAASTFVPIDSLDSTSTTQPLSANQGRVLDGKITDITSSKGMANGIASLDSTGKLPYSQLPESAMEYKGTWNANTNTPTLTQGVGTNGDFYVVSVAGTWDSTDFAVGDRLLFDENQGTTGLWVRLTAGEVQSVNGQTGVVNLGAGNIPFNNTGTTISSTDTEAAIKEVYLNAGTKVITTTMADYLAHKSEYDATGNMYEISDAGVANTAGNVSFDDTLAQIGKNNVQGAIEKNSADISTISSNLSGQDYVELITSGQSYSAAIDTLFSMININKIQPGKSCLLVNNEIHPVMQVSSTLMIASHTYVNYSNKLVTDTFTFYISGSKFVNKTDNDVYDNSSTASTGVTLRFIY